MKLPKAFEDRMRATLGDEYDAFAATYDEEHYVSLKVNTLKIDVATFLEKFPYPLRPVPWTTDGFYYNPEDPVTKHPYFYAGLYYVQEPSAMSPVNALRPSPGEICLDLCAAPGGKSMQIATFIEDKGLLVTNDINETRVKAILRNVEKFGLRNVIVLNNAPDKIAKAMGHVFTSILVDAPCSGEGMFRKDPKAVKAWETYGPRACSELQRTIIDALPELVAADAKIIYSTCTFAPEENEEQIKHMLSNFEGFTPRAIALNSIGPKAPDTPHMAHIWPHKNEGEGHFIGGLMRTSPDSVTLPSYEPQLPPEPVREFFVKHLKCPMEGHFVVEGERVFLRPELKLPTRGLNVVREGLLIGEISKGRFSPSQALALALKAEAFQPLLRLSPESVEVMKYLKGETIFVECLTEGLHLVCVDDYPLGFAKISNGTVKNLLPVSWRMM